MSSDVSESLAGFRPTGCPIRASPPKMASTKFGWAAVPSSRLKTEMQRLAHAGVAALAESVPNAIAATAMVSTQRAGTFFLTDIPILS